MFIALGADPLVSSMSAEAKVTGMFGHAGRVRELTTAALDHVDAIGAVHQPWVHIFNAELTQVAGKKSPARCAAVA